jgi:hypothetical protein
MWSHDMVSANRRPLREPADGELDEVWARCRRQELVIHTLEGLVATLKADARSLEAENLRLRAETGRPPFSRSGVGAQPPGETPAEAAVPSVESGRVREPRERYA